MNILQSNFSICNTWRVIKKINKNDSSKINLTTWNEEISLAKFSLSTSLNRFYVAKLCRKFRHM